MKSQLLLSAHMKRAKTPYYAKFVNKNKYCTFPTMLIISKRYKKSSSLTMRKGHNNSCRKGLLTAKFLWSSIANSTHSKLQLSKKISNKWGKCLSPLQKNTRRFTSKVSKRRSKSLMTRSTALEECSENTLNKKVNSSQYSIYFSPIINPKSQINKAYKISSKRMRRLLKLEQI